jgi:hypothetical protein
MRKIDWSDEIRIIMDPNLSRAARSQTGRSNQAADAGAPSLAVIRQGGGVSSS